jgi:hypothetical protein
MGPEENGEVASLQAHLCADRAHEKVGKTLYSISVHHEDSNYFRRATIGIGHKACLLEAPFKTSFTCGNDNPTRKYFKVGSSDTR